MKTTNSYKQMILSNYKVGDQISPSMKICRIGTKYVTCISNMDSVHFVRYAFIDFVFNFMNR